MKHLPIRQSTLGKIKQGDAFWDQRGYRFVKCHSVEKLIIICNTDKGEIETATKDFFVTLPERLTDGSICNFI